MPIVRLPVEKIEIDQILLRRTEGAEDPYSLQVSVVGFDGNGAPVHQLVDALTLDAGRAGSMTIDALAQWLMTRITDRLTAAYGNK